MAGVQDLLNVSQTILSLARDTQALVENWSTVTIDYESKVESLKYRMSLYDEFMGTFRVKKRDKMMVALTAARDVLQGEQETLKKLKESLDSSQWWDVRLQLSLYLTMVMFPQKLEKQLKRVTDKFDEITKGLKTGAELNEYFKKWREREAILTTTHNNDGLYVPILESQNAVTTAIETGIEKPDGKPLVLLHGGVGKGKSTIARYLCWRYGDHGSKANFFDYVIPVLCGNSTKLDPWTKQSEILQHLSPSSSVYTAGKQESASKKARIAEDLRQFLRGKKVLIILDDVSDQRFLYEMWKAAEGAKHVKYLVTSQRSDLCGSLTSYSSSIEMSDPNPDEARKILAALVGLEKKEIPDHLKAIADQMIRATDGNPLALACLASNFAYSCDKENKRAWQDAYKSLCNLLDHPQIKIVLGQNHDTPPRSSWAALGLCLENLETTDAKVVLFLIYSCTKGESVPEEVLRILYVATNMSSATFFKASAELLSRELLQPSPGTLAPKTNSKGRDQKDEVPKEFRSLRCLVKLYMDRHLAGKEEIKSILGTLFCDNKVARGSIVEHKFENTRDLEMVKTPADSEIEDAVESEKKKVAIALCALYFDRAHIDKVVVDKAIQASKACTLIGSSDRMNQQRREAIEPIIWLLDQPEDDKLWTESKIRSVRQVFIKYLYQRQLDEARISDLLKLTNYPSAPLATLTAIANIFSLEETSLLNENSHDFLKALVDLLGSEEQLHREAASKALLQISRKAMKENKIGLVASTPHLLDKLVGSIEGALLGSPMGSNALAENAEATLRELGYSLHYTQSTKERDDYPVPGEVRAV